MNAASLARPDLIRQGTITALACWFAVVLAFWAHLDNPWWAAISAWVIAHPERQAVLTKGLSRVIGTLIGWLAGCCLAFLVEGAPVMQALVIFVVAATGTYCRYRSQHSYAWTIGAVGALIVLATSLEAPGNIFHLAWYRALEILCGVFAATLVELMFARVPNQNTAASPAAALLNRPVAVRLAVISGITLTLIPILWAWLNLPSLTQIAVSSFVVLDRDIPATSTRGLQRLLGCLAGGALGLLAVGLEPESFFIWSIAFGSGIFLFAQLHHSASHWAYVGTQGGVAFILALVTGRGPPNSILPAVDRIAGMICGVLILLGVCRVIGYPRSVVQS
jgi:Predicted membrane protein